MVIRGVNYGLIRDCELYVNQHVVVDNSSYS
jgi:hypothetical protein